MRILHLIGLGAIGLALQGAEDVVLTTGFHLTADRHEQVGEKIRLYTHDGQTDIPAAMIVGIEASAPKLDVAAPEGVVPAAEPAPVPVPVSLTESTASRYALPEAFLRGVMKAESNFNPQAISPKGAIGLMQLMPATARALGANPANPAENADAGARYLRDLLARYESSPNQVVLALAAYNAGPAAVEKYHGVPPFRETREYILRVLKVWKPESFSGSAHPKRE